MCLISIQCKHPFDFSLEIYFIECHGHAYVAGRSMDCEQMTNGVEFHSLLFLYNLPCFGVNSSTWPSFAITFAAKEDCTQVNIQDVMP